MIFKIVDYLTFKEYWGEEIPIHDYSEIVVKNAWETATLIEGNRCVEICDQLWRDKALPTNLTFNGTPIEFTGTFDYYQDVYRKGWLDACKECALVIRGKEFTQPGGPDPVAQQDRRLPAGLRGLSALED